MRLVINNININNQICITPRGRHFKGGKRQRKTDASSKKSQNFTVIKRLVHWSYCVLYSKTATQPKRTYTFSVPTTVPTSNYYIPSRFSATRLEPRKSPMTIRGYCLSTAFLPVRPHCENAKQNRLQEAASPLGELEETTGICGWRLFSRTWNPITSPWMKQLMWLRTVNSGDWCPHLVLCTPSGACHKRRRSHRWPMSQKGREDVRCEVRFHIASKFT